MKVDFHIDRKKAEERLGINPGGRVQAILDASLISHIRRKMPKDSGTMISNTKRKQAGLIIVETPYAHYMNEGIKYIDPKYKVGAFPIRDGKISFDTSKALEGFISRKHVKKISSGKPLNYHGGANRGAHFVERTLNEDFDEILRDAKKGVKK